MKHSIRTRMTIIFSMALLSMLVICWLANIFFLERYYVSNKQQILTSAYEQMDEASRQGNMESEKFVQKLGNLCEVNNIGLLVMGSDGHVKMYTMKDYEQIRRRLYMYTFGKMSESDEGKILKETSDYVVRANRDTFSGVEYLEMMGALGGGELFVVRAALEPIRESVDLANRFLVYVGIGVLLIGTLVIRHLSRMIAEPILELARLSESMGNLDFNVKFEDRGKSDEVSFLGNHMNQLSEALEQTISELKTANNELQRDIEQREKNDEMRKEFLSNVSHELKTPIALVQGYAEGLKECINDDQESREFYCDVIIDEASKMNNMVKNLLTLNELEFGTETVTMERFDINAMIHNMLQSSRILFEQKGVHLVYDEQEPVYVWANEFKLEEVMNNYISNALHHVAGENIIKITVQKGQDSVRVGVFNTGMPIPEQDVDRIWDKFYKVDKARTREYGGSGVGLSIVKAIMESMHRNYGVNNYDNGVEFWFDLDCSPEA